MGFEGLSNRWNEWRAAKALRDYRCRRDHEASKPRATMNGAPRSLSISRDLPDDHSQQGSHFLTKFGQDVRRQIIQEVLSPQYYHIIQKGNRLAFLFCTARDGKSHTKYGCWGYQDQMDGTFTTRYWSSNMPQRERDWDWSDPKRMYTTDGEILNFMLTCRMV
jgi:hypothetical protein